MKLASDVTENVTANVTSAEFYPCGGKKNQNSKGLEETDSSLKRNLPGSIRLGGLGRGGGEDVSEIQ